MMAVTGGIRRTIHISESLGMTEIARVAEGQVQRDGNIRRPIRWDLELAAQDEIGAPFSPIGVGRDDRPGAVVKVLVNGRRIKRAGERLIAKGSQRLLLPID